MIGLGLVTTPERDTDQVRAAFDAHLRDVVDMICESTDKEHRGVAWNKNQVLTELLDAGCDWLFVSEDDVIVQSPLAVTGYLDACERSGYSHLMFHAHGTHNPRPLRSRGCVTEWPNYVGAWCVYSRESLLACGLFDEGFHNAWEHVEHSLRLAGRGYTAPWQGAADATGSECWIEEVPGSIQASVIRRDPEHPRDAMAGREYWRRAHPETYQLVFG